MGYRLSVGGKKFDVEIGQIVDGFARVSVNGALYDVTIENAAEATAGIPPEVAAAGVATVAVKKPAPCAVSLPNPAPDASAAGEDALCAPLPGLILEVRVKVGDAVTSGQIVAIVEAMKMENNLIAQKDGIVRDIRVQKGAEVSTGDVIMIIH